MTVRGSRITGEDEFEISDALSTEIASWRRVFIARGGADPCDLLRRAAADLWRTLEIDRTVHPESGMLARQAAVDALADMAEIGGIPPDDAQQIFASAFKRSSHSGNGQDGSPGQGWNDPDWSLLDTRRGELPNFPADEMPGKDIIVLCAHGAGVSFDHVAVPLLAIASGVIGTARRVKASRSFTQPAAMWAAVVGLSGTGKTPGVNVAKRALVEVERSRRAAMDERRRSHEARREAAKVAREQWKAKLKETAEGNVVSLGQFRDVKAAQPMPIEAEDPGPFIVPRLFVSDVTIEKLAELITARPSGALVIIDELAALFLNMSRYSAGSDKEFWLQAWNGDAYRVERLNRDPVDLDHLLVGVVGGLQPDKLSRSFQGDHDGMYARILFSWPQEPPYQPLTDAVAEIEPEIFNALKRLVDLKAGQSEEGGFAPRAIPLTDGARRLFEDLRRYAHLLQEALDGRERDWVAKMPAHVLRLALTLCLLDYGFRGGPEPKQIGEDFVSAAITLARDYFFPHARAALRQIGLSEKHATARRVLRWIRATHRAEISILDIRRDCLAQSLDEAGTLDVIAGLEKAGWLQEITIKTGEKKARAVGCDDCVPKPFSPRHLLSKIRHYLP